MSFPRSAEDFLSRLFIIDRLSRFQSQHACDGRNIKSGVLLSAKGAAYNGADYTDLALWQA